MIKSIEISNFKSIENIKIDLGRINVFIGENGAGKSNILESIALAGAAESNKLDNEFLASRGVRVSAPEMMRSAFRSEAGNEPIGLRFKFGEGTIAEYKLFNDNKPYSSWTNEISYNAGGSLRLDEFAEFFKDLIAATEGEDEKKSVVKSLVKQISAQIDGARANARNNSSDNSFDLSLQFETNNRVESLNTPRMEGVGEFVIFSPEHSALRSFEREGQLEPLGVNGEGLLKLILVMAREDNKNFVDELKNSLRMFGWFEDFSVPKSLFQRRNPLRLFDRYLNDGAGGLSLKSANDGFLFVTFYIALFSSQLTPKFFAVDNIDSSLNPKLCTALVKRLYRLACENDKQAIVTAHNPSVLDGIDIGDENQKLFIVSRSPEGRTNIRPFQVKRNIDPKMKLSQMFMSGMIGGLPKGF